MLKLHDPQPERPLFMNVAMPAIVVVAYNRPLVMNSLLETLRAAVIPEGAPLVISIEGGAPASVVDLATAFEWPHGPKRLIVRPERLGLREHILRCGDLSQEYGAVIVLEDDLIVSPHFYTYASQALTAYADNPLVGGVALYSYPLNEFNNLDFEALNDGGDVYFLQVACSWGQAWTWEQWRLFRAWYETAKDLPWAPGRRVPRQLTGWKPTSWKRYFIKYLSETDRFFVYPRHALTSNTAKPGTHTKRPVSIYQTPLDMRPRQWRFTDPATSMAVYTAFYELTPAALARSEPAIPAAGLEADIWGGPPIAAPPALSMVSQTRGWRQGSFWHRYRLIEATSPANARAKLMFYVLKPIQTEINILLSRWRATRASR